MTTTTITTTGNSSLKRTKIIYWITTTIFFLFDSVGALFFNTQPAIEGIQHMGFPDYFRVLLSLGKIIGGILLIVPAIPHRFKEWAYVGFGISLISATIGHIIIDGAGQLDHVLPPLVVFIILLTSYVTYHKIKNPLNLK
jgi:hypothetical protein